MPFSNEVTVETTILNQEFKELISRDCISCTTSAQPHSAATITVPLHEVNTEEGNRHNGQNRENRNPSNGRFSGIQMPAPNSDTNKVPHPQGNQAYPEYSGYTPSSGNDQNPPPRGNQVSMDEDYSSTPILNSIAGNNATPSTIHADNSTVNDAVEFETGT